MKKKILMLMAASMLATNVVGCSAGTEIPVASSKDTTENNETKAEDETTEVKETATTITAETYSERTATTPTAVISADLYENFKADGTVFINFSGNSFTTSFEGVASADEISIKKIENSEKED